MDDIQLPMVAVCLAWLAAVLFIVRSCQRSRTGSVGLPAAYMFATTFLYVSAFLYCVPGYSHRRIDSLPYLWNYNITDQAVLAGAIQTSLAMISFAVGVYLYQSRAPRQTARAARLDREGPDSFANSVPILAAFAIAGFAVMFLRINIPGLSALSLVAQNVGTVLVCLGYYNANAAGNRHAKLTWLAIGIAIPVWNVVALGFLSSGFTVATIIGAFLLTNTAARTWRGLKTFAAIFGVAYFALSAFVAYLSGREEIRKVIWGQADFIDRFVALGKAFSEISLLTPFDFTNLDWIAIRLNQAAFVGKMVEWHEMFPDLRTNGASLLLSLLAWVPRALWPGKPENAGNQFIETNTGLHFSEGARFGAGQIFEFYVNLGSLGVVIGMLVMGLVLAHLDARAARALRANRLYDCVRNFAIGTALIVPLSDIFFMVSTCAATWIALHGISFATKILAPQPVVLPPRRARR